MSLSVFSPPSFLSFLPFSFLPYFLPSFLPPLLLSLFNGLFLYPILLGASFRSAVTFVLALKSSRTSGVS